MLAPDVALAVLADEAERFVDVLGLGRLDAAVPGCPGWTVGDLGRHLGGIHRWAREAVLGGPGEEPAGPDDAALPAWLREGAALLVDTLRAQDPDAPCWGFGPPPRTVRFWLRRQAHETSVHRWDAQTALGLPARLDDALALDGLDEVATVFLPRQLRLGRLEGTGTELLLQPDGAPALPLRVGGDERRVAVAGPAEALLLLVWGRLPLSDPRLSIHGDADLAADTLSLPLVP